MVSLKAKVDANEEEDPLYLELASTIHDTATTVLASNGMPLSFEGLKAIGVEEKTALLVAQQVFGCSTTWVMDQETCGVCIALDLVNWEEMGILSKTDVDLKKIDRRYISNCILSWIKLGDRRKFYNTIGPIGKLLRKNAKGKRGEIVGVVT